MSNASSSLAQMTYIKEATFGVTPVVGNRKALRFVSESLDFQITKEASKEINATRTISSMVPVEASASGGFQAEPSYLEYDEFLESTLQSTWAVYGTNGVQAVASNVTFTATTLTAAVATSGADSWATLQKGQWFKVNAPTDVNDGKILRVSSVTAPTTTVITLDASTPAVVSGPVVGCTIATSRLTHGTTQTSFSLQRSNPDITQFMAFTGCTPSKLDISLDSGALSSISFDFMGKSATASATDLLPGTTVPSKTYDIHSGASGSVCQLWEGGAPITGTFVKSLSMSYDNALRAQTALCSLGAIGIGSGTISITGSMSVYFADANLFTKFKNNVNSSLTFSSVDGAGNGYIFTIPVANVSSWKTNASGKDSDMMVDVQFTGLRDASNATATLQKALFIDRVGVAAV